MTFNTFRASLQILGYKQFYRNIESIYTNADKTIDILISQKLVYTENTHHKFKNYEEILSFLTK